MPEMESLCHGCDTPLDTPTESRMAYCASCDDEMLTYLFEINAPAVYAVGERVSPTGFLA